MSESTNLHEKLLEGLPELATHPAVDAEVERIGEADEEVDDQRRRVHELVVEELVDARRHVVQDDNDAHRKLDCQEHLKSQINTYIIECILLCDQVAVPCKNVCFSGTATWCTIKCIR